MEKKKIKYIAFLFIFIATICAGFTLLNQESYALGIYTYVSRYKSGLKFVRSGGYSTTTMGYFKLNIADTDVNLFCGAYGKSIYDGTYSQRDFLDYFSYQSADWQTKVQNILLLYNPYSDGTNLPELKEYLRTNYSEQYSSAGMDALTAPEAISTFQAALWHFTNDQDWSYATTGDQYNRIMMLYSILLQSTYGNLKNISLYTETINFEVKSNLAWSDTNLVTTIGPNSGISFNYTSDNYTVVFKTNNGTIIPTANYTSAYSDVNNSQTYTFTGITQNADSKLVFNNEVFDTIVVSITATSTTLAGRKAYVYVPNSSGNYQIYLGSESTNVSTNQTLSLPTPNLQSLSIKFNKMDMGNPSGSNLSGAYLKLYRIEEANKTLIKEWATGQSYYEISGLIPGTYVVEESITPTGYQKVSNYNVADTTNHAIAVSSDTNFDLTSDITTVNIVNSKTKINLLKQDLEGNNIPGAKFNILDIHGDVYYTFTSTTSPISIEGVLETGVYFIEEYEAPTNYKKSDKLYRFALGNEYTDSHDSLPGLANDAPATYKAMTVVDATIGNNSLITLTNNPGISVSKKDFANDTLYVIGATLTITKRTDNSVVETWQTTAEDHLVYLEDGDYTLTETVTPGAYATAEAINFTVLNGKVTNNVSLNMKDKRLNVCIAKKALNVASNLSGAKFEVYDSDNVLVASFTSEMDEYCFNENTTVAPTNLKIVPGRYTIKEVSAPTGYSIRQQYTEMEILNKGDLQTFEIYNDVSVPRTDLNVSQIVYIMAIVLGTCGIGMVVYYVKKYIY